MSSIDDNYWFVRPMTEVDQPFLWEMLYHAIFVAPGLPPPPRDIVQQPELARYARGWGRAGDLGFLAATDEGNEPIGAAWLRLWEDADHGYGYLDAATPELTIAVLPEHRGRGIGTSLLDRILHAADRLHPAVALSADRESRAVALYQRMGFVVTRRSGTSLTMVRSAATGSLPSEGLA